MKLVGSLKDFTKQDMLNVHLLAYGGAAFPADQAVAAQSFRWPCTRILVCHTTLSCTPDLEPCYDDSLDATIRYASPGLSNCLSTGSLRMYRPFWVVASRYTKMAWGQP